MPTKSDQVAAERLLKKAVAIGVCYATLAKTNPERAEVAVQNASRFYNAIVSAALLVEDPAVNARSGSHESLEGTTC